MNTRSPYLTALLLAAGVAVAAPACATQTYGYRPGGGYYERDIQRRAYDSGYQDGIRAGERDGRSGRSFSYNRHDDWRDADSGYHRDYGSRDMYRRTYRNGFERGYSDAYNRYSPSYGRYPSGRYPGNTYPGNPYPSRGGYGVPRGGYYSAASENGYRDGFEAGRNDARDGDRFDPVRAKRYREGDHDYDSRYGSRDAYKQEYRNAFRQGYEDGYRGNVRR
jgi:hypothetical protein